MFSNKARQIVIDDTDPEIKYKGHGWSSEEGASEFGIHSLSYNNTLHRTNTQGRFSYTFNGTSIAVLGIINDINMNMRSDLLNEVLECFIDRISIANTSPETHRNNRVICEQHEIANGKHELEVRFRSASGNSLSFDSIHYTPSPGLSFDTAVLLVDNRDSGLYFDSNWEHRRFSSTQTCNSTATFNFTGTAVSWVGAMIADPLQPAAFSTYTIDGGPPIPFNVSTPPSLNRTINVENILFNTPKLSPGPHTLVVTYGGSSDTTPLTLNHLYVTNSSAMARPTQSEKHRSPVGVIVGSVIGGLLIVIALMLFMFWWYRWQKRCREPREVLENSPPPRYTTRPPDVSLNPTHPNFFGNIHRLSFSSDLSGSSLALSGYNPATIAQTRALRKCQETNLHPVRRSTPLSESLQSAYDFKI